MNNFTQNIEFKLRSNVPENKQIHTVKTELLPYSLPTIYFYQETLNEDEAISADLNQPAQNNFEVFVQILEKVINYANQKNLEIYELSSTSRFDRLSKVDLKKILEEKNLDSVEIVEI